MKTLGLSDDIFRAVAECGYTTPTPIQQQVIPLIMSGKDIIGSANTGTGKTAAFVLPILHALTQQNDREHEGKIRAVILVPTRELAVQVEESVRKYGANLRLKSMILIGGVSIGPQMHKLRGRMDIVVATPGRLLDHVEQRTIDLSHVKTLVLDEADRMMDMGFIKDIKRIIPLLPRKRQNLLFSATFSGEIKDLVKDFFDNPTMITAKNSETTAALIEHIVYLVDANQKKELLEHLISENHWYQVLVFTRTKHCANQLGEFLQDSGISTGIIHGNKTQAARQRALERFKKGTLQVLVATDVAARGIDIVDLPYVVNYELPFVAEDYVHRIGRTGRAGKQGYAVSLVCVDERQLQRDIERLIKVKLEEEVIPGFEPDLRIPAKPLRRGGGSSQGRGKQGGNAGYTRSGNPTRGNARPFPGRGGRSSSAKPQQSNRGR
jgi:ATP-dependent RNA helicase RhlE